MKRTYLKLLSKHSNKTLKLHTVEANRATDAFLAHLLGWGNIELDGGKEWIGDTPNIHDKIFNCIGRCVIPKFTTENNNIISAYIMSNLKNSHITITITNNSPLTGVITTKKGDTIINADTLELLTSKILIFLLT